MSFGKRGSLNFSTQATAPEPQPGRRIAAVAVLLSLAAAACAAGYWQRHKLVAIVYPSALAKMATANHQLSGAWDDRRYDTDAAVATLMWTSVRLATMCGDEERAKRLKDLDAIRADSRKDDPPVTGNEQSVFLDHTKTAREVLASIDPATFCAKQYHVTMYDSRVVAGMYFSIASERSLLEVRDSRRMLEINDVVIAKLRRQEAGAIVEFTEDEEIFLSCTKTMNYSDPKATMVCFQELRAARTASKSEDQKALDLIHSKTAKYRHQ